MTNWPDALVLHGSSPSGAFSQTRTFAPSSYAATAALAPAPPRPSTTTSYSASQPASAAFEEPAAAELDFSLACAMEPAASPPAAMPSAAPWTNDLRVTSDDFDMRFPFRCACGRTGADAPHAAARHGRCRA